MLSLEARAPQGASGAQDAGVCGPCFMPCFMPAEFPSVPATGELYRVSLRRQKFPAQGSIEIHEDSEVGRLSEAVWAPAALRALGRALGGQAA